MAKYPPDCELVIAAEVWCEGDLAGWTLVALALRDRDEVANGDVDVDDDVVVVVVL